MENTKYMNYTSREEYFEDYPDEEEEFIEEMAQWEAEKEIIDYPEDWTMFETKVG